jgi:protein involved in polysaccharide export with SLBB domain
LSGPAVAQPTPVPPEPLTEFQKFAASTTGQILPIYGADLFRRIPSTFAPLNIAPVPSDYVIGPGDELRIRIWGQVNFQANLRVDRSGEIYLPQVGQVHVAGLAFSALDSHLREAVGRVYRNFDLTADLGQIRAIQIYVAGEARRPGVYTVSSLSTLVDALFASGGPSVQGSLRSIELRRNGAVATRFDLYDLLIRGDKSKDAKLLAGDVIYIPPVGPQVAVTGSVHNPAIYELLPGETLGALLADAGGVSTLAAEARISIERIDAHRDRHAMEVAYDASGKAAAVDDGDIVRVYSIVPKYEKTVTLRGNIANPGRFAWHEGMRLSDLIPDKASLLTRNYWWRRTQMGLPAPEFEPLPGLANMRQPSDSYPITIPQRAWRQGANSMQQSGLNAMQQSGLNAMQQSGLNAGQAGGLSNQYDGQSAIVSTDQSAWQNTGSSTQNQPLSAQQRASNISLAEAQSSASSQTMAMAQGQRTEVRLPAAEIDWDYAVIERLNPKTLKTELLPFDLGKLVIDHDATQDLTLEPGDIVSIFSQADIRVPLSEETKLVRLEGEFVHAGVYSVQPGETLRDLVRRAGGLTPNAYLYGSQFTRVSTRAIQQARIDEYVQSLSLSIQRSAIMLAVSTTNGGPGGTAAQSGEQSLLASLRQIRATGRIVLTFLPGSNSVDSIPNIPLEDGDSFVVPHTPATVNVVGAVYDQNSFLFKAGSRAGAYLHHAGGTTREADRRHEFVIRADGEVVSRDTIWDGWEDAFDNLRIYPGDTIVVPEKTLKLPALASIMNWSTMFSQLALGAAVLTVLP